MILVTDDVDAADCLAATVSVRVAAQGILPLWLDMRTIEATGLAADAHDTDEFLNWVDDELYRSYGLFERQVRRRDPAREIVIFSCWEDVSERVQRFVVSALVDLLRRDARYAFIVMVPTAVATGLRNTLDTVRQIRGYRHEAAPRTRDEERYQHDQVELPIIMTDTMMEFVHLLNRQATGSDPITCVFDLWKAVPSRWASLSGLLVPCGITLTILGLMVGLNDSSYAVALIAPAVLIMPTFFRSAYPPRLPRYMRMRKRYSEGEVDSIFDLMSSGLWSISARTAAAITLGSVAILDLMLFFLLDTEVQHLVAWTAISFILLFTFLTNLAGWVRFSVGSWFVSRRYSIPRPAVAVERLVDNGYARPPSGMNFRLRTNLSTDPANLPG